MTTHTKRAAGALIATLGMIAGLLAGLAATAPAAHAAPSWSPLSSGTTQQISAVDYRGSTIAYATSGGQLGIGSASGSFTVTNAPSGALFTDLALNPSGNRALAVGTGGNDGELYVYDGITSTWSQPDLSTASVVDPGTFDRCWSAPVPPALADGPVTNVVFHSVAWASDTVGYVVGTRKNGSSGHAGYALKTTDGGATWTDMQNRADRTCMLTTSSQQNALKNVVTTPNSDWVWLHGDHSNNNALYRSTNGLDSASSMGVSFAAPMLAIDPNNTQRQAAAKPGTGYTNWYYTDTMWSSSIYAGRNQGHDDTKTIRDLAASPNGWFYIVGDGGLIERTKNGTHAEKLPAAGALAGTDWRSIAFASNSQAVVAGVSGRLAISSNADQPGGSTTTPPKPNLGKKPPVKGKGLAKKGKNRYVLRVKGRLRPPNGVSRKQACRGTMRITVKGKVQARKFRNVIKKRAKVKKNCKYAKKVVIKGKKARKLKGVKKLKLVVKFQGNKVMAPVRTAYKLRMVR